MTYPITDRHPFCKEWLKWNEENEK